jgi:hypothetical protein
MFIESRFSAGVQYYGGARIAAMRRESCHPNAPDGARTAAPIL